MKYLRANKCSTGQAKKNYKGWQWSATMERFRPFVNFAQTASNVSRPGSQHNPETTLQPASKPSDEQSDQQHQQQTDETEEMYDYEHSFSNDVEPALPLATDEDVRKRKRKVERPSRMSNTEKAIEFLKSNRGEVMEDIDYVMLGYAKTIKKFSPRGQVLTKLKIAEIIANQELDELNYLSRPSTSSSISNIQSDASNTGWEPNSTATTPEQCSLEVYNSFKTFKTL